MGRALVGDDELDIRSGTCSVGKYVRQGDGVVGQWDQTMNGDCSMLEKGEEVRLLPTLQDVRKASS